MVKNKLYHYCRLSTAIEFILPGMQLRLSPINNTNDPKENKDLMFAYSWDWDQDIKSIANPDKVKHFSKILRDDCKLICFSVGQHLFGFELLRMWASYGDKHQGVCLEIDKNEFMEENPTIAKQEENFSDVTYIDPLEPFTGHIQYDLTEVRGSNEIEYLRGKFRNKYKKQLYFTKTLEWQSEQEVRLLHFSENPKDKYCSIRKSLRRIILGVDFKDVYLPTLQFLFNKKITKLKFVDLRLQPEDNDFGNLPD